MFDTAKNGTACMTFDSVSFSSFMDSSSCCGLCGANVSALHRQALNRQSGLPEPCDHRGRIVHFDDEFLITLAGQFDHDRVLLSSDVPEDSLTLPVEGPGDQNPRQMSPRQADSLP